MAEEGLKNYVSELGKALDANYQTQIAAANNREKAKLDFLQAFRNEADRTIIPVFEASCISTDALTIKVENRPDVVSLNIRMKKDDTDSVSGFLRYRANQERRQIFREEHVDRLPNKDKSLPAHPHELTQEHVERFVESLLHDAKYALENKPR